MLERGKKKPKMPTRSSAWKKRKQAAQTPFVSKAADKEIRDYQLLASKFAPMDHEEFIEVSKEFVKGRDAGVKIAENALADFVLDGDWSASSIKEHESELIAAFEANYDWIKQTTTAKDLINRAYGKGFDLLPDNIDDVSDINVLAKQTWLEPMTLRTIAGDDDLLKRAKTSKTAFSQLHDKWMRAIEKAVPTQEPKDVCDRWKSDTAQMKEHFTQFVDSIRINDKSEKRRLSRLRSRGEDALEKMINHNLQLAMSRISKVLRSNTKTRKVPIDELIAVANLGLVLGARQFDPYQGRRFSTYATFHIDGQLSDYVNNYDETCGIKGLTPHEQKQFSTIKTIQQHFRKRYGYDPSNLEVQSITGISADIIEKRLGTPMVKTQNIHAPIKTAKADDEFTLADMLASEEDIDASLNRERYTDLMDCLHSVIGRLDDKHREVLMLKTGIELDEDTVKTSSPMHFTAIAQQLGITNSDAQRTYEESVEEIGKALRLRGYDYDSIANLI